MTLRTKLIRRFQDKGYRHAYVGSFLDASIATQIKVLREARGLSQAQLAERSRMRQSQVSSLEDVNNSVWKVSTLKRLAEAFDLALVVKFEDFGKVLPGIESFDRATLQRTSFDDDPVFCETGAEILVGSATDPESQSSEMVTTPTTVFRSVVIPAQDRFGLQENRRVA